MHAVARCANHKILILPIESLRWLSKPDTNIFPCQVKFGCFFCGFVELVFSPGNREIEKGLGRLNDFRSLCCSTLFGLLLGGPALCQTSSTPADQSTHAASSISPPSAPVPKTDAQPEKSKPPTAPGDTARTAEENRERLLLDRIGPIGEALI